ncbi:hypothetical protein F4779DRAFT_569157 [Xylariaceae sp. FL0662B]|nr:hypothetical protein F4779DRAFT_569157 [Xylariaceae sp. FL0662B]
MPGVRSIEVHVVGFLALHRAASNIDTADLVPRGGGNQCTNQRRYRFFVVSTTSGRADWKLGCSPTRQATMMWIALGPFCPTRLHTKMHSQQSFIIHRCHEID